jgi:hypothetical protein
VGRAASKQHARPYRFAMPVYNLHPKVLNLSRENVSDHTGFPLDSLLKIYNTYYVELGSFVNLIELLASRQLPLFFAIRLVPHLHELERLRLNRFDAHGNLRDYFSSDVRGSIDVVPT